MKKRGSLSPEAEFERLAGRIVKVNFLLGGYAKIKKVYDLTR
jgi:hypothetical protein